MIYDGWTRLRWSGRVMIATDPGGAEHSIGEIDGPATFGAKRAILLHPVTGHDLWTAPARSVEEARMALAARYGELGGAMLPAGVEPGSVLCRVTQIVARHPEGIAAGQVARELGTERMATGKALQRATASGLIRASGLNAGRRYWPIDGPDVPGLPSPGGEPAAVGAQNAAGSPSSAGDSPSGPHAPVGSPEPPPPTPGIGSAVVPGGLRSEVARVGGSDAAAPLRAIALDGLLEQQEREVNQLRWDLGEAEGMLLLVDRLLLVYAAHLRGEGRRVQVAYVAGVLGALAAGRDLR